MQLNYFFFCREKKLLSLQLVFELITDTPNGFDGERMTDGRAKFRNKLNPNEKCCLKYSKFICKIKVLLNDERGESDIDVA